MADNLGMPPSRPTTVPPMSRRAMLITFATAALVILCLGGTFLLGGLGLVSLFSEPTLDVSASAPPPLTVGETYEISLTFTNTGSRALKVTEIQLPLTLFEGSDLESSLPAFAGKTDYSGRLGFTFAIDLPPGQSQTVVFRLKALHVGDYTGEARVMSGTRAKPVPLHVQIDPLAPTPTPTAAPTLTPEPSATPLAALPTLPNVSAHKPRIA